MDLKRQIRLRISTEMYDVLMRICNNNRNINLSRLIRYFVETGLEGLKKKISQTSAGLSKPEGARSLIASGYQCPITSVWSLLICGSK